MNEAEHRVRARIEEVLRNRFGRVEEELIRSGILDSLRTIEFALDLEEEFGMDLLQLTINDTATLTTLTRRLVAMGVKPSL